MGELRTRVTPGAVVAGDAPGMFDVNVDGVIRPAGWPAGYIPTAGDVVQVLIADSRAIVLGPAVTTPRPGHGTIAGPPVNRLVPVLTDVGQVRARFAGDAPATGELVLLDWQMTTPRLLGAAAVAPPEPEPEPEPEPDPEDPTPPPTPTPKPPPPPPPPPKVTTGTLTANATVSSTWGSASGWNRYGDAVRQYRYGSEAESTGAWFYGTRLNTLKGATVTKCEIWVPARQRIGSYNASATLNIQRHTSRTRPSGNVSRTGSVTGVSVAAGWSGGWKTLPVALGQALVDSGGGLAIHGAPYAGVVGLSTTAASGRLRLTWRRG